MLPNLAALSVDDPEPTAGLKELLQRGYKSMKPNEAAPKLPELPGAIVARIIEEVWMDKMEDYEDWAEMTPWNEPCDLVRMLCSTKLDATTFFDRPWAQGKNVQALLKKLNGMALGDFCKDVEVGDFLFEYFEYIMEDSMVTRGAPIGGDLAGTHMRPTTYEWWWRYWKYLPKQYPLPSEKPEDMSKMDYLIGLCDAYAEERAEWMKKFMKNPEAYYYDVNVDFSSTHNDKVVTWRIADSLKRTSLVHHIWPIPKWMRADFATLSFLLNNMDKLEIPSTVFEWDLGYKSGPLGALLPFANWPNKKVLWYGVPPGRARGKLTKWWIEDGHAQRIASQVLMLRMFPQEVILSFLQGLKAGRIRPTRVHLLDAITVLLRLEQQFHDLGYPLRVACHLFGTALAQIRDMFADERNLHTQWATVAEDVVPWWTMLDLDATDS